MVIGHFSFGQSSTDTAALVKEFNKVMSFAVQPYLYYKTVMKMESAPVLQSEDTVSNIGTFYKNQNELYYNNGQEEMFLEDSLLVQINNERKTIWISKVDVSSKEKMDVLPLSNKHLQELFRKKYSITKRVTEDGNCNLTFEARQNTHESADINSRISLEYNQQTLLPKTMGLEIQIQQAVDDEILSALKNEGRDVNAVLQTINGVKYVVRKQLVSVQFENIDTSKEKAQQIPSWRDRLDFTTDFAGKGIYKDYELTKTF